MKKIPAFLLTAAFALLLTACGNTKQSPSPVVENSGLESQTEQAGTTSPTDRTDTNNLEVDNKKEADEMTTIQIIINGQEFDAELYNNEAVHQFREMLPLQLDMEDLHDNEKYFYFSDEFKTEDQEIEEIQEGDLMIYGDRCLVLFYEDFETDYKYTPLGKIPNTAGLTPILSGKRCNSIHS